MEHQARIAQHKREENVELITGKSKLITLGEVNHAQEKPKHDTFLLMHAQREVPSH